MQTSVCRDSLQKPDTSLTCQAFAGIISFKPEYLRKAAKRDRVKSYTGGMYGMMRKSLTVLLALLLMCTLCALAQGESGTGDSRITLTLDRNSIQLNDTVTAIVSAPGAMDIHFHNSQWVDGAGPDDEGNATFVWTPSDHSLPGTTVTMFAEALFSEEEGWVKSSTVSLDIQELNGEIEGEVKWTLTSGTTSPRDGIITLEVDPVAGAENLVAYLYEAETGHWVVGTDWREPAKSGKTLLQLPAGACEAGASYTLAVSAIAKGKPWKDSEHTETIQITAPAVANDILFSMRDTFETEESLNLAVYYTNPDAIDGWMQVVIYPKDNAYDHHYDNGNGFDFRDEYYALSTPGTFVIHAYVYKHVDGQDDVLYKEATKEITVSADKGALSRPVLTFPPLLAAGQDFAATLDSVPNAEHYSVQLNYCPDEGPWDDLDWHFLEPDPEQNPLPVTYPSDLFSTPGRYRLWIGAFGRGYAMNSIEVFFNVAESVPAAELKLESENGENPVENWPSSKNLRFRLYAPGAHAVRLLDFNSNWFYLDGNNQNDGWFNFEIGTGSGSYAVLAQAAYDGYDFLSMTEKDWETFDWNTFDWENAGFTWTKGSNTIPVTVTSAGTLEPPAFTVEKTTVAQGEMLVIQIGELQGKHEWYGARLQEDGWESEYYPWNEETKTIYVPTTGIDIGEGHNYRLMIWTDAEGYEGNSAFQAVTISETTAPVFTVSTDKPLMNVPLTVSIFAPGAEHVGFAVDGNRWDLNEDGSYGWGDCSDSWTDRDNVCFQDGSDGDTHVLSGYALYEGQWQKISDITVTLQVLGSLEFDRSTIPAYLNAGADAVMPVHVVADCPETHIFLSEDWDDEDGYHRNVILDGTVLTENTDITVPAANLVPGHRIILDVHANRDGYYGVGESINIPVLAQAGDGAVLTLDTGDFAEDGTPLVDGDLMFKVTPAEGKTLKAVRFYDGNGYWENGADLTPEGSSYCYDEDGNFFAWCGYHDEWTYTVFADVLLEGSDTWFSTNVIQFTPIMYGNIGVFDFTSLDPVTVRRGETVTFTFTQASGANRYWLDAFTPDRGWNPQHVSDGNSVTMATTELPAGEYDIWGRAGGAAGYRWTESTSCVQLTVTEPEIPESGILVNISDEVLAATPFILSVLAPGAEKIRLAHMDEENVWWEQDGESRTDFTTLEGWDGEVQTFYVWAMFDGVWSAPVTKNITVKSLGTVAFDTSTLPDSLEAGSDQVLHIIRPDADDVEIGVFEDWDDEEGYHRATIREWAKISENTDITIPAANLTASHRIILDVNARKPGYTGYNNSFNIPVRSKSGEGAVLTLEVGKLDDAGQPLLGADMMFQVTPEEGKKLEAVRFYNGYGYWENGADLTPETSSYCFDDNGNFFAWNSFNDDRDFTVFADVLLEGSDTWFSTNTLQYHPVKYGDTGSFAFTGTVPVTVKRGEMVIFTFTEAEHADRYWVDVFSDGDYMETHSTSNGTEVTLMTANLPVGEYEVRGLARGDGWTTAQTPSSVHLTVTDPEIPESGILLNLSKDTVTTLEDLAISIVAPGAERVRLAHWQEDNIWRDVEGDSLDHSTIFVDQGEQTFYASAMYEGVWSEPVTAVVTVECSGESPAPIVMYSGNAVAQGSDFGFSVDMPEGAQRYSVWGNDSETGESVLDGMDYEDGMDFTVSTQDMQVGDSFDLTVRCSSYGMNSTYFNLKVHVVDSTTFEPTMNTPASLKSIEDEAFLGIPAAVVQLSEGTETIGEKAFADSSLKMIGIPASVTDIKDSAFEDCPSVIIFCPDGSEAMNWAIAHEESGICYILTGNE